MLGEGDVGTFLAIRGVRLVRLGQGPSFKHQEGQIDLTWYPLEIQALDISLIYPRPTPANVGLDFLEPHWTPAISL